MFELEWIIVFALLGSFVGFIAGLLGVGGGGILVPVLSFVFLLQGMPEDRVVHMALGTSMACIIVTSASSLLAQHKKAAIHWGIAKVMSVGVVFGAFIATGVVTHINSVYLAVFFAVFMAYTAVKMLKESSDYELRKSARSSSLILPAVGIGALSALVSIGGGSLTVPYLARNYLDIKKAIGTSAAIGLPVSLSATAGYLINGLNTETNITGTMGFIYIPALLFISVTSFLTAPYGVKLSHFLPVKVLKRVFACLLVVLGVKMLFLVI